MYRTKQHEKQKPSLTTITLAGAPDGTQAAWADFDAVTLTGWLKPSASSRAVSPLAVAR